MSEGHRFTRVYPERFEDEIVEPESVRKLIMCSGKLYYELLTARRAQDIKDVAIVTLEQICPFPFDYVAEAINKYPNAEVVWAQEEPKNMGAYYFVQDRIQTATRE